MAVRADLIIVGAGLAGAAAAWQRVRTRRERRRARAVRPGTPERQLARERADLPPRLSGSAVRAADRRSGTAWHALEWEAAEPAAHLDRRDRLRRQARPGAPARGADGDGVPAELLPAPEAARRWPQFDFTGAGPVMFHEDCGVLDPDRAIAAMLRVAAANGADIRFDTPVTRLEAGGDGAIVRTGERVVHRPGRRRRGRRLDRAAARRPGRAAAADRDAAAGLPLRAAPAAAEQPAGSSRGRSSSSRTRKTTATACPAAGTARCRRDQDRRAQPGHGHHGGGPRLPRRPGVARPGRAASCRRRVPGLDPRPGQRGDLPLHLDRERGLHPRPAGGGPFVVASPCSGHGAKFAPLLGEIIADLAAGEPPPSPASPWPPTWPADR